MTEALDVAGRLLPSMALIVGLLLLLRRWAQRGAQQAGAGIKVLARAGITRGASVAVVALGDRRFLVGASEHGISLLAELDDEQRPRAGEGDAGAAVTTTADVAGLLGANRPREAGDDEAESSVPLDLEELVGSRARGVGDGARAQEAREHGGGDARRLSVGDLLTHGRGGSDRPRTGAGAVIAGSGDGPEGLVDRLRAMTVRTHVGRPIRGNGM